MESFAVKRVILCDAQNESAEVLRMILKDGLLSEIIMGTGRKTLSCKETNNV